MSVYTEENREILKIGDFGVWKSFRKDGTGARCLVDEFGTEAEAIAKAAEMNLDQAAWKAKHEQAQDQFFIVIQTID